MQEFTMNCKLSEYYYLILRRLLQTFMPKVEIKLTVKKNMLKTFMHINEFIHIHIYIYTLTLEYVAFLQLKLFLTLFDVKRWLLVRVLPENASRQLACCYRNFIEINQMNYILTLLVK